LRAKLTEKAGRSPSEGRANPQIALTKSAIGDEADIETRARRALLMTQSGHSAASNPHPLSGKLSRYGGLLLEAVNADKKEGHRQDQGKAQEKLGHQGDYPEIGRDRQKKAGEEAR